MIHSKLKKPLLQGTLRLVTRNVALGLLEKTPLSGKLGTRVKILEVNTVMKGNLYNVE
jgi:hypothetical protein